MNARPGPPHSLTPREREGLRQSVTQNVRAILTGVPTTATYAEAQRRLYSAGIAAPLPVVAGWVDAVRDAHNTQERKPE